MLGVIVWNEKNIKNLSWIKETLGYLGMTTSLGKKEPEVISLISEKFHIERISLSKRGPEGKELDGQLFVYNTSTGTAIMVLNHDGKYYGNYVNLPYGPNLTEKLLSVQHLDEKMLQVEYQVDRRVLPCQLVRL